MVLPNKTVLVRDLVIILAIVAIINKALTQLLGVLPADADYISTAIGAFALVIYYGNLILTVFNELNTNTMALLEELRKG
jgi:hypothetical protein